MALHWCIGGYSDCQLSRGHAAQLCDPAAVSGIGVQVRFSHAHEVDEHLRLRNSGAVRELLYGNAVAFV